MSVDLYLQMQVVAEPQPEAQPEGEQRFAQRRRIVLMEPDRSLRAVLVRTFLRLGCVVTFQHSLAGVVRELTDGAYDGVVVALDDLLDAAPLHQVNDRHVPVVVLAYAPPDPFLLKQLSSVRFVRKPFDVRELLAHLHLPEKATIATTGQPR